jgi:hypothetical protein
MHIKIIQLIRYRKIKALRSDNHTKHINARCGQDVGFLDAFGKLRKATIGFVMPTCPSVRIEQLGSLWTDFMIFYI